MAENNSPSWWQTMPGILTGLAAIITAVTGLMLAFNRTSGRNEPTTPSSTSSPPPVSREVRPTSASTPVSSSSGEIPLPEIHQVKLEGAVITVLSAKTEPLDAERRSLTFRVRYQNTGGRQANFWSNLFQLIVDDTPRAQTNFLDDLVDAHSAKEGDAVFELPPGVKDVVLQITSGDEKRRLPFKLP